MATSGYWAFEYELRYTLRVNYILDFKDLVWRKECKLSHL